MKLVKFDSFRSQGTLVNQTDDMYRVVVDMSRREFLAFKQWVARQNAKESPENNLASSGQPAIAPVKHGPNCGEYDTACAACRGGYRAWVKESRRGLTSFKEQRTERKELEK